MSRLPIMDGGGVKIFLGAIISRECKDPFRNPGSTKFHLVNVPSAVDETGRPSREKEGERGRERQSGFVSRKPVSSVRDRSRLKYVSTFGRDRRMQTAIT